MYIFGWSPTWHSTPSNCVNFTWVLCQFHVLTNGGYVEGILQRISYRNKNIGWLLCQNGPGEPSPPWPLTQYSECVDRPNTKAHEFICIFVFIHFIIYIFKQNRILNNIVHASICYVWSADLLYILADRAADPSLAHVHISGDCAAQTDRT